MGDDIVYTRKPCLKQMIEVYDRYQSSILGVQEVEKEDVSKYGIVDGVQLEKRIYRVKGPVSYTHLDVYKRQLPGGALRPPG